MIWVLIGGVLLLAVMFPAFFAGLFYFIGVALGTVIYCIWWVCCIPVNLLLWICGERK